MLCEYSDSTRSQIVDILNDPTFKPAGWDSLRKPALSSIMDTVIYELHVRDFSVFDTSIPAAHRGTYNAFDYNGLGGRTLSNVCFSLSLSLLHPLVSHSIFSFLIFLILSFSIRLL